MSEKTSGAIPPPAADGSSQPPSGATPQKNSSLHAAEIPSNATPSNNGANGSVAGGDDPNMAISPQKTQEGTDGASSTTSAVTASGKGSESIGQQQQQQPTTEQIQMAQAQSQQQSQAAQIMGGLLLPSPATATAQQQHPQNPHHASMFHPMFSQYAMLTHPQFQQMTPQQQQMLLFQQQLMMQQMTQQSIQQQILQQSQYQASANAAAAAAPSENQQPPTQFSQLSPAQQLAQQQSIIIQQQLLQQSIQQQLLQQSHYFQAGAAAATASAAASVSLNQQPASQSAQSSLQQAAAAPELNNNNNNMHPAIQQQLLQQSHYFQAGAAAATASAAASVSLNQQPASQSAQSSLQQAAAAPELNNNNNNMHPAAPFWNLQNHPQGIPPSGIEAIYQADESNYQAPRVHHDSDDDEDDDGNRLLRFVEDHHWVAALQRITTHPRETQQVGIQGRTPLHVACDHDAPPALVQALLNAWPEGAERVGTSHMNPLHITCSSPHASVDVVRVLLAGCRDSLMITGAKDVDGDTPLHAACRCAAPMDVLVTLLQANPITVTWKDYEGLNPLMRLWVRYFVLVGEHIISNIKQPSDLNSDLVEAWQKSLLLLKVMSAMENRNDGKQHSEREDTASPFLTVHASSSVDCPRCVVRIATVLFPQELLKRDEKNRLPIHIAAAAPVYAVHDLRGEGFTIDDAMFDDDPERRASRPMKKECKYKEPSVIDILLSGDPSAASERDRHGQLPLHVAIMRGKTLDQGVQALVEAYPDALEAMDNQTNLFPFMLAASVGRGRGDCTTIYALLRAAPELVHMALTGEPQNVEEKEKSDLGGGKPKAV
ncbi:hypothetical protein ACHAXR_013253 [Thalassiosira sp. AJA248-18]